MQPGQFESAEHAMKYGLQSVPSSSFLNSQNSAIIGLKQNMTETTNSSKSR
jgi:hypothetical protein